MKMVFLVDSSTSFLAYLELIVTRLGYKTRTARTAGECLSDLRLMVPDMVVAEAHLPDGGGVEICRAMKVNSVTKDVPVVVVTTDGSNGTQQAAMDAGATDFLTKPVTTRTLFNLLEGEIGQRRRKQIRTPYVTEVEVGLGSGEQRMMETSNLGEGGMYIKSGDSFSIGEELSLRFSLRGRTGQLTVRGEVLYVFAHQTESFAPGMGVKFVGLAPDQQSLLSRHIEDCISGPRA